MINGLEGRCLTGRSRARYVSCMMPNILVGQANSSSNFDNQIHIFLFVNPRSGSRQGKKFLDLGYKLVTFELSNHAPLKESGSDWRRAVSGDLSNQHVNLYILDVT